MCLIAEASGWLDPTFWFGLFMAVFALGVVIFVHELGHFLVAKACGVKCMKFYIGFDPPLAFKIGKYTLRLPSAIWKRQWGETEYGIGVIPLGGYVRMLGQDDNPTSEDESPVIESDAAAGADGAATTAPKLDPRNYQAKSVPQRMAIISAGVIMNVIFAYIFALTAVYVGVKYTPCLVARTQPGDPAWRENVLPGDKIVEINGVKNPRFTDLQQQVLLANAADGLKVVIERPGQEELIHLTLKPDKNFVSGNPREMPRLGVAMESSLVLSEKQPTFLGSSAAALPEKEGFRGGDRVVAIDGVPVPDSVVLEKLQVGGVDKPLTYTVERLPAEKGSTDPKAKPEEVKITVAPNPWRDLGLTMTMGPINQVRENSPATRAKSTSDAGGIQRGDKIVAIDGVPAGDPITLPMRLRAKEGREVKITVERPSAGAKNDAAPQKIEFTTTLETPTWNAEAASYDSPAAWLALGATYHVSARVAAPPTGPAAGKGIEVGDEVVQVDLVPQASPQTDEEKELAKIVASSKPVPLTAEKPAWPLVMAMVQDFSPKTSYRLKVKNEKATRDIVITPELSKELFTSDRGLALKPNLVDLKIHSFPEALDFAWRETKGSLMQVVLFLRKMTRGDVSPTAMAGPISIFRIAAFYASQGLGSLLLFLTLLSANLAVINFLPIPILDGGHMVFLAWEGIFRKPMSRKVVEPLMYAGAMLLLSLMLFTTVLDVQRLFNWL